MTKKLPQQIQIAKVLATIPVIDTLYYYPVPLGLSGAANEVAIVEAYEIGIAVTPGAVDTLQAWIWRKSIPNVKPTLEATWPEDSDVLDYWIYSVLATEGDPMVTSYKLLPRPLILIRDPQFVVSNVGLESWAFLKVYYTLAKVSDADLAQLMVKDHA